ncbi:hypothetical protein [Candidatus Mycoplasma haematominutum]|uniref:Uncharacterized protein n=1 Tax=Candidatus Mycoplasma haematominutum 'Birmingham 1' TaxID=1116213 RepID=G8C2Q8_9MOLU|nr:hypothetical protein [Candidatus Mycoplasma haematominutum]CCE66606.1 hypothetical protein MHM_00880 [Candidatus Mycoplasma haematominutum 'Birmingham 1']
MTGWVKFLLSLVSVAGVSSAAGVPIVLTAGGDTPVVKSRTAGSATSRVTVESCELDSKQNSNTISFGAVETQTVCWNSKSGQQIATNVTDYSQLLTEQWSNKDQAWNTNLHRDKWSSQCVGSDHQAQWATFGDSSGTGVQYLGVCGETTLENTKFVKKVQSKVNDGDNIDWTFWTCDSNCWKTNVGTLSGTVEVLQPTQEETSNWKEIVFWVKR